MTHCTSSYCIATKRVKESYYLLLAATEAACYHTDPWLRDILTGQSDTDVPAICIRWTIILALQLSDVLDLRI